MPVRCLPSPPDIHPDCERAARFGGDPLRGGHAITARYSDLRQPPRQGPQAEACPEGLRIPTEPWAPTHGQTGRSLCHPAYYYSSPRSFPVAALTGLSRNPGWTICEPDRFTSRQPTSPAESSGTTPSVKAETAEALSGHGVCFPPARKPKTGENRLRSRSLPGFDEREDSA